MKSNTVTKNQDENLTYSKETQSLLDTIELTSDYSPTKTQVRQAKKGFNKAQTNTRLVHFAEELESQDSSDKPRFFKRFEAVGKCLEVAMQERGEIRQWRCKQSRLCKNCARAEAQKRIAEYTPDLVKLALEDTMYMVTLTAPRVKAGKLKYTIDQRLKAFARVKDNMRKNHGIKLQGLRKLEVTYEDDKSKKTHDTYHPHFHFLIQGETEARLLQALWLNQFRDASIKAQHMIPIHITKDDSSNLLEVFKYATKQVVKNNTQAKAEINILRAIDRRRIFQTFGELQKVYTEKLEDTESNKVDWKYEDIEIFVFQDRESDWVSSSGERLVDLSPKQVKEFEHYNKSRK